MLCGTDFKQAANHPGWRFFYAQEEVLVIELYFTIRTGVLIAVLAIGAAYFAYELWRTFH